MLDAAEAAQAALRIQLPVIVTSMAALLLNQVFSAFLAVSTDPMLSRLFLSNVGAGKRSLSQTCVVMIVNIYDSDDFGVESVIGVAPKLAVHLCWT
jgi:hypothetical protein